MWTSPCSHGLKNIGWYWFVNSPRGENPVVPSDKKYIKPCPERIYQPVLGTCGKLQPTPAYRDVTRHRPVLQDWNIRSDFQLSALTIQIAK